MSTFPQDPIVHHMHNANGLSLSVMDWGATMLSISINVPSENKQRKLLIAPKTIAEFKDQDIFLNATIGRYANRIGHSQFTIDGTVYNLESGSLNCLHGGIEGFNHRRFTFIDKTDSSCTLQLQSPDLDQGFPGNFTLTVNFSLLDDDTLKITYHGQCDKKTYASITNHAYFNLNGTNSSILDHELYIDSDAFLELDEGSVPTGKILKVKDREAFDFNQPKKIGQDFLNDAQMIQARGYDHPYLIKGDLNTPFLKAKSADGKVCMSVASDYPCFQFYSGNYIHASCSLRDENGAIYANQSAFCVEPGYYPDGPNLEIFKDTMPVVDSTHELLKTIVYKFNAQ